METRARVRAVLAEVRGLHICVLFADGACELHCLSAASPPPVVLQHVSSAAFIPPALPNSAAVVACCAGGENDAAAIRIIGDCFPGREIVGVDCTDIIKDGGALHCMSQHHPAV